MRLVACLAVFLFLSYPSCLPAAAAEEDPDREMLMLLDLLEQWEMINDLEPVKRMELLETTGSDLSRETPQPSSWKKTEDQPK
ncbi:MAG: hypothetical protein ACE5HC_10020 [Candidatus Binatia bacterium]